MESADMMLGGRAAIQSMWSPGVSLIRRRGLLAREAIPQEGYRAWHGGLCLAAHLSGRMLDVAYEYLNWWLDGWAGAVVARQGYYMSVPQRVRKYLSAAEWNYWYEGEPASEDLAGPDGETHDPQGRDPQRRRLPPAREPHRGVEHDDGRAQLPRSEMGAAGGDGEVRGRAARVPLLTLCAGEGEFPHSQIR